MMQETVVHPQEASVPAARLPVVLSILLASLTSLVVAAQPDAAAIEQAVRQLGDPRFAVRDQASKRLWEAGAAAEPALRRALQSSDAETLLRARDLLDKLAWGIYADTPPAVLEQIESYRNYPHRLPGVAHNLVNLGKPGGMALAKLAGRVHTAEDRQIVSDELLWVESRTIRPMLLEGDIAGVEAFLEMILAADVKRASANYTAFMIWRGQLDEAIARWEAEARANPSARAAEVLVALYRAKGDFAAARRHAAGRDELLNVVFWEQGDWAELARRPTERQDLNPVSALALRATYHRLAGNAAAADAALAAFRQTVGDWRVRELAATGLLFNERPADAVAMFTPRPDTFVSEFLTAQLRYREALDVIEKAVGADGQGDRPEQQFRLQQARLLAIVGETDRAGHQFDQLAGELGAPADSYRMARLVAAEMDLGLKDAARTHTTGYLAKLSRQTGDEAAGARGRALRAAFPNRAWAATVWWTLLRQEFPQETESAAMKRLCDLLDPPAGAPGPGALAKALLDSQPDGKPVGAAGHLALAAAYEAAGQLDAAQVQLTAGAESAGGQAWMDLGHFHRARGQFAAAADAYEKDTTSTKSFPWPVAHYLFGWSLVQAGRVAEGQARMNQAHALSLGNITERRVDATWLTECGLPDLARRELALAQRLCRARDGIDDRLYVEQAREAVARQNFAGAADAYDHIMTGLLDSENILIQEPSRYLSFPALARAYRARAALAAGHTADALAHAHKCLELTPGSIDLAVLLVPELDRRGQKADADALYARIAAPHDDLCREFTRSGRFHNDRAWLAACCRRDLDAALDHARTATAIEPQNAAYRDTLAEVHFQRGDRAAALEQIGQALALDPKNVYYFRQKQRIEAGDSTAPRPAAR
jgi:tetratricopeptide (TPR) repeat protein